MRRDVYGAVMCVRDGVSVVVSVEVEVGCR